MKYKAIYTGTAGLFAKMQTLFPTDYEVLFGDTEAASLDAFAVLKYGERLLTPKITDEETAASYLTAVLVSYMPNWLKIAAALKTEYVVGDNYAMTETKTGGESRTTANTADNVQSGKPFDATEFVEQGKENSSGSTDDKTTYNITTERKGNSGKDYAATIGDEITLRKRNVIADIISSRFALCVCPPIYPQ